MTTAAENLEALADVDRQNRVGRTVQQVAPVSAAVAVLAYLLSFAGIDLAPLDPDSENLPEYVVASLIALGTWLSARHMNRPTATAE